MPTEEPVVKLQEITRLYFKLDGSVLVKALGGIDLDIPKGQSIAIMGASGSGKSTLMNILGCLDRPTDGSYILSGQDVATLDDREISIIRGKQIGFVFQSFNLIPQLTIEENVEVPLYYQRMGSMERRRQALEILDRVGLSRRIRTLLSAPMDLRLFRRRRLDPIRGIYPVAGSGVEYACL